MKKNIAVIVLSVLLTGGQIFAVYLLNFLVAISAINSSSVFPSIIVCIGYAVWGISVIALVTACFAIKKPKVARIGALINLIAFAVYYILAIIQFVSGAGGSDPSGILSVLAFASVLVVSIIITVLAFKMQPQQKVEAQPAEPAVAESENN